MPPTALRMRAAAVDDAPAVAELMRQLGYPTSSEEMAARLNAILSDSDFATLVALVAERIVGMVGLRRGPFYERNGTYAQVLALVVDEARRGPGIGAALLAEAERWMRAQGVALAVVNSGTARADAHRFYHRAGCHTTGIRLLKEIDA